MTSPARFASNGKNAQNSTGPTSVEGKAVTRFNAMKHGLDAASLVIPGEDPAELATLAADFHREYAPEGAIETELVEIIIRSTWFQHRYARLEARLFEIILNQMEDPATATIAGAYYHDAAGCNVMGKLFRRQQAAKRDFDKALADLRRLQKARVALEMFQSTTAPALARAPVPVPVPVPKPAVQPPDLPYPKNGSGKCWVGSEPLSWRL